LGALRRNTSAVIGTAHCAPSMPGDAEVSVSAAATDRLLRTLPLSFRGRLA